MTSIFMKRTIENMIFHKYTFFNVSNYHKHICRFYLLMQYKCFDIFCLKNQKNVSFLCAKLYFDSVIFRPNQIHSISFLVYVSVSKTFDKKSMQFCILDPFVYFLIKNRPIVIAVLFGNEVLWAPNKDGWMTVYGIVRKMHGIDPS